MSTDRHFNFTVKSIKAISPPEKGKRAYYQDTQARGLELIVTHTGRKTFYFYRKFQGKPIRILIGTFPEKKIEQARGKAAEYSSKVAESIYPRIDAPAPRKGMNLQQLFNDYIEKKKLPKNIGGKLTWREDVRQYNQYLKGLSKRKIASFTRNEIEDLHTEIGKSTPCAANRLLALLRAVFNHAIRREHMTTINPASKLTPHKETQRTNYLSDDEISLFMVALDEEFNRDYADIFALSLFTGARRTNLLSMKWEEIDWSQNLWTIPKTKNGYEFTIPLYEDAVEILKARADHSDSAWVFPSHGKLGHIVEVKSGLKRVLERANIQNICHHDLRRTFATILTNEQAQYLVIKHALGHRAKDVTMGYARVDLTTHREAINTVGNHIRSCASSSTG